MKQMTVHLLASVEIEVDERVSNEDLQWACNQALNRSDGRHPFSAEMFGRGAHEVAGHVAVIAQSALATRICDKYPGARNRGSYLIAQHMKTEARARHGVDVEVLVGEVAEKERL